MISGSYPDNPDGVGFAMLVGDNVGAAEGLDVVGGVGANEMPIPNVEKSPEFKFLWQFA